MHGTGTIRFNNADTGSAARTGTAAKSARRGFTLAEVMLATVILAIGLIGLGAIFPAVISQQRDATDLSMAISAGTSAEAIMQHRLERFASVLAGAGFPANETSPWMRIVAYEPGTREAAYLRMPTTPYDLRLQIPETESIDPARGFMGVGRMVMFNNINLRRRPISVASTETIKLTIKLQEGVTTTTIVFNPRNPGDTTFYCPLDPSRISASGPNEIDYPVSRLKFNIVLRGGERILSITADYVWLNDRLVSHQDRLYPRENPRYGWDVCFRRTAAGAVQYCLFVYRFDGEDDFLPDFRDGPNMGPNEGMLVKGDGTIGEDSVRGVYTLDPSGPAALALDRGAWILPWEGTGPLKLRRAVELDGDDASEWELDAPPLDVSSGPGRGSGMSVMTGRVTFWYMAPVVDNVQLGGASWKIKPIIAYTKQLAL